MTVDLVNGGTAPSEPTNATAIDRIARSSIGKGMRIAQVAPLAESVPPKLYGGTERVVAWLVEELVELGHEVTLFASGDSITRATLVPAWPRATAG